MESGADAIARISTLPASHPQTKKGLSVIIYKPIK